MKRLSSSYIILIENLKRRDHLGVPGLDWSIILKWILETSIED
jgi:hypothetical protein